MVALSSSTVAKGGMSMVAWALWALVLVQSLAHASSRPSEKYGGGKYECFVGAAELVITPSGPPSSAYPHTCSLLFVCLCAPTHAGRRTYRFHGCLNVLDVHILEINFPYSLAVLFALAEAVDDERRNFRSANEHMFACLFSSDDHGHSFSLVRMAIPV